MSSQMTTLQAILDKFRADLKTFEEFYRQLHSSPELSGQEEQTALYASEYLKNLEFEVHTNIGGYGVAEVLPNGDRPTVLLRTDTDALPVQEKTGLSYASRKTACTADAVETPVMNACSHDVHTRKY
ncbi:hypothetical protein N7471_014058 [Penicillium samsonianum]|uniref:uncharacterized protein n=1 Tax=Penicillium samsonianum TaxID=1882272 RepID=UPI0025492435|nr:uncharacterized protein N7471_014058 [Penicillium samsonianum]KAJ6118181.1 hypothetical protein N7471_014058 [Penicillium samsonianum]